MDYEEIYEDDIFDDDLEYFIPEVSSPEPRWTRQRVIYLIIAILIIVTLLAWTLYPVLYALFAPPPPEIPSEPVWLL